MNTPRVVLLALVSCFAACAQPDAGLLDADSIERAGIANLRAPSPTTYAAGQPTPQQFRVLAAAGVRHIVNLRPGTEQDWNEQALVESLGMQYHLIPVADGDDVTFANARALERVLDAAGGEPVLVHCKSGNRVGALAALAARERGEDLESAVADGRSWGLTRLEPLVRKRLSETSAANP